MFDNFLKFINVEKNVANREDFIDLMNGKSFLNGMYRLFSINDVEKWNEITEKAFPKYKNYIVVFGYDWLGRIFAINKLNGTVLMFEPGTGEVLSIPVSFEDFHDSEIVEYHEDCLASEFFEEWYMDSNNYELQTSECVGYKVPLFLNGDDDIDNLEVSDMEVYWEIMMPLINM